MAIRKKVWSAFKALQAFLDDCDKATSSFGAVSSEACCALYELSDEPYTASLLTDDDLLCITELIVKPAAARVLDPGLLNKPGVAAGATAPNVARAAAALDVQLAVVEFLHWVERASRAAPSHAQFMSQTLHTICTLTEYQFWMRSADKKQRKAAHKVVRETDRQLGGPAPKWPPFQHKDLGMHRTLEAEPLVLPYLVRMLDAPALLVSWLLQARRRHGSSAGGGGSDVGGDNKESDAAAAEVLARCADTRARARNAAAWLACQLLSCTAANVQPVVSASLTGVDWTPAWRLWLDPRVVVKLQGRSAIKVSAMYKRSLRYQLSWPANVAAVTWSDGTRTSISNSGQLERSDDLWPLLHAALNTLQPAVRGARAVADTAGGDVGDAMPAMEGLAAPMASALRSLAEALQQLRSIAAEVEAMRSVRRQHIIDCFVKELLPLLSGTCPPAAAFVLSEILTSRSAEKFLSVAAAKHYGCLLTGLSAQTLQPSGVLPPRESLQLLWLAQDDTFHAEWSKLLLGALMGSGQSSSAAGPSVRATGGAVGEYTFILLLSSLWGSPAAALESLDLPTWDALLGLCGAASSPWPLCSKAAQQSPPANPAAMLLSCLQRAATIAPPSAPPQAQAKLLAVLLRALGDRASAACNSATESGAFEAVEELQDLATSMEATVSRGKAVVDALHERCTGHVGSATRVVEQLARDVAAVLSSIATLGPSAAQGRAPAALQALGGMSAGPRAFALRRALLGYEQGVALGALRQILSDPNWPLSWKEAAVPLLMRLCGASIVPSAATPVPGSATALRTLPAIVCGAVKDLLTEQHLPAVMAAPLGALELEAWASVVTAAADDGIGDIPVCAKYLTAVVDGYGDQQDPQHGPAETAAAADSRESSQVLQHLEAMARVLTRHEAAASETQAAISRTAAAAATPMRQRYFTCLPGLVRLLAETADPEAGACCCELLGVLLQLSEEDRRALQRPFRPGVTGAAYSSGSGACGGPLWPAVSDTFLCAEVAKRAHGRVPAVCGEDFDLAHAMVQRLLAAASGGTAGGGGSRKSRGGAAWKSSIDGAGEGQQGAKAHGLVLTDYTVKNLRLIQEAAESGRPLLLSGDTGVGKTASVAHVAGSLGRELIRFNLSAKVT